jgi:hypothetical protein
MEFCLLYYKSQTQAHRASEILENYHIAASFTKPPRDHRVNYCAYAVRIAKTSYAYAYDLLCINDLQPIHCKSVYLRGRERL